MKAVILAGGENKRLPVIKGFLEIDDRRIIDSCVKLLQGIFDGVIISTNNPEWYCYLGVPMVGDIVKHRGPMTGILSSMISLDVPEVFVTACDMPFVKPELIKYIVNKYESPYTGFLTPSSVPTLWDAVIPMYDNKPQPLLGIYSKRLVDRMGKSIQEGNKSLRKFLKTINVLSIRESEVRALDPEGKSFVNINTLEDYEKEIGKEHVYKKACS